MSNASGTWEVYAWDRVTGTHRQVTDRPNGTFTAELSPDGERIWWFADTDGDEFGSWVAEPFGGRPAGEEPAPAVPGTVPAYPAGLDVEHPVVALGASADERLFRTVVHGLDIVPFEVPKEHAVVALVVLGPLARRVQEVTGCRKLDVPVASCGRCLDNRARPAVRCA